MTRNGKIARLPHGIREKLNRRLRDNVPGTKICEWVNRFPACRKVCAEFARRGGKGKSPVTVNQLSEWRRGGYQDWLQEQRVLDESRELREWCGKLARNGGDLTEGAAALLSGQLLKVVRGLGNIQASKRPSSREIPSSNIQNRTDDAAEPCAPSPDEGSPHPVSPSETGTGTVLEPAGGDACATLPRGADTRTLETERMESEVRVLGEMVKCLSGIRRGDQNRVRLAQLDKKLALRSELARITTEKYEKEKAKEEELERQKRAVERQRKQGSGLSDYGKIDFTRGETFGPARIIREKEAEIKEAQKDLELLKAKWQIGQSPSNGNATNEAPSVQGAGARPSSVQRSSKDQAPKSTVASAVGPATPSGSEHGQSSGGPHCQNAGSETGAPNGREPIRVHTSACDQSAGKIVDGGQSGAGFSAQKDEGELDPVKAERELNRIAEGLEAHRQGAEFDLDAAERDQERIGKWLKALLAKQEAARIF